MRRLAVALVLSVLPAVVRADPPKQGTVVEIPISFLVLNGLMTAADKCPKEAGPLNKTQTEILTNNLLYVTGLTVQVIQDQYKLSEIEAVTAMNNALDQQSAEFDERFKKSGCSDGKFQFLFTQRREFSTTDLRK